MTASLRAVARARNGAVSMAVFTGTRMHGSVILSHGFESGPEATKTMAMAAAAAVRGWQVARPDYRDLDAHGLAESVAPRLERLAALCADAPRPLVLAGSSMGAFVSGLASLQVGCAGLFLLALPVLIPGYAQPFACAAAGPVMLVHGQHDDICPAHSVVDFAARQRAPLWLVPDGHRLADHVEWVAAEFGLFLDRLEQTPS